MSGFVAVIALPGRAPVRTAEADAIGDAYAAVRPGQERHPLLGDDQVRVVPFGAHVSKDAGAWTVRHGRAYGRLPVPITEPAIAEADGQFALITWNAADDAVIVANDKFGAAPIYVAQRDGRLLVSTSALSLARLLRPAVDPAGLRAFLVTGYQFGTQTHWQGVRRLDPATAVHVSRQEFVERTYWRPTVDPSVERLNLADAVTYMTDVAVNTLRTRLNGESYWLDLTGGYDSRLLALLAKKAGVSFAANTRDAPASPDVALASEIAQASGWSWHHMPLPGDWPDRLPVWVRDALAWGDARLEVLQLSRVLWPHSQLARASSHLLSAGGGEHLQFHAWQTEPVQPGRTGPPNLARWVDMIAIRPSKTQLLASGSLAATREDYLERFTAWARTYRDQPKSRQLDACYAYKNTGHFGAYRAADDGLVTAELPYFFEPIFTAAFSLRHRHRTGFRLMRRMMHGLDPVVAGVKTTRGGPALPVRLSTAHRYLPYYGVLARKAANKLTAKVSGRPLFSPPSAYPWPEHEANAAVVRSLSASGILDWRRLRIRPLLDASGVDQLEAGNVDGQMLGRILTAELALAVTETGL